MADFEQHRQRLFAVAYRLLGSAAEAEDAVQDTYLRWHAADQDEIREPAAWLTKVLTNLCLTRLTSARARRESYVGPWLPEPLLTAYTPLDTAELRESVSMAFLLLLERLTPAERAVFVLREAFEYSHREIADVLDLTEANCQQLYHRAKQRVAQDRPRFDPDGEEKLRITKNFLVAARSGNMAALEGMLAEDVVAWADGGGKTRAARKPIHGRERAKVYLGWLATAVDGVEIRFDELNGEPAILIFIDGALTTAISLQIVDGLITAFRAVANPDKLTYLTKQVTQHT
ncbi:RNA polymerase sigma-70 factor [Kutzneria buriramensis]|uniref:RNA polymerase sigma-70 factor (ECF subfamily) n=1 Tax=Kutzneria buriramensis TaxID=1045776 RepID=A0A3E0IB16_9PSEU|nr:RNA polymerase sigma-70 factor [Kutzneria buriramensis]REH55924.1 RNA polymerase sigma-70 factor (ECF subfamily) [Kutzneria buriramensis]